MGWQEPFKGETDPSRMVGGGGFFGGNYENETRGRHDNRGARRQEPGFLDWLFGVDPKPAPAKKEQSFWEWLCS